MMKILVGYKRVVDYSVRTQVKPNSSGVVTDGVKLSTNPFDAIAMEFASLGVEAHDHLKTTHYAPPAKRGKGVMVKDAAELVAALKQKGLL